VLSLPERAAPSPAAATGEAPIRALSPAAPPEQHRPPMAAPARLLQDSRERAAALEADLDAALTLRAAQARQLAGMPRVLDGGPNPIHQRRTVQLGQQDALIAALRGRLADLRARIGEPEQPPRSLADGPLAPDLPPRPPGSDAAAPRALAGTRPIVASVPTAPRLALLAGVLALAVVAGAVVAVWRGQHDGIIDHPSRLPPRTVLPLLCSIALPGRFGRQRRARAGPRRAALAALGLLGLFVTLVVADRFGALAPPGEARPAAADPASPR
jgi:hypothetical protein